MSGISRLLAKELSAALGITDNPKFNPMFKQTDEVLSDVADPNDPTVARFYSPLESAIENAPIGKEGTRGENVEAFVRKRAPKVSKAEMEFRGLGLSPSETYTAEGAKESLGALDVKAVRKDGMYRVSQRQSDLDDAELSYNEVSLETDEGLGLTTHMGESSLAHTRYSERSNPDGNYFLIEELQSDPLQNAVDDFTKFSKEAEDEFTKKYQTAIDELTDEAEFTGEDISTAISAFKSYVYDTVIPTFKSKASIEDRRKIFSTAAEDMKIADRVTIDGTGSVGKVLKNLVELDLLFTEGTDAVEALASNVGTRVDMDMENLANKYYRTVDRKKLPVSRITDTIRMSLQAIIADAKAKGINEIVLPPVEKLAEKRFNKADVSSKIAKGSAFHNTYVAAYEKVLKQLKDELGDQIKIGKKPLKYRAEDWSVMDKKYETKQGTLLDISNLTVDPTTTKLRFNKGGLVERPE
jgi:hypothetical protein